MRPVATGLLAALLLAGAACAWRQPAPRPEPPRLTVVVVVDQCRSDYLDRFAPLFGADGFARLRREGARGVDAAYRHGRTETGPGHATIGTGADPAAHGIVGNGWIDRDSGKGVYCAGPRDDPAPGFLAVPTLAEAWKRHFGDRSRVLSLAFKDRAAVLLGGMGPDATRWWDDVTGRLVTSRTYAGREATPARADATAFFDDLAASDLVGTWVGRTWEPLPLPAPAAGAPPLEELPPDDRVGEAPLSGWRPVFPKAFAARRGPRYHQQLKTSPFGDDYLLTVVERAIADERLALGRREGARDLVLVGLSSLDYIGHAHGPYSHEVRDELRRLDLRLAAFLRFLDAEVGAGRWTLAMSADHGVAPIRAEAERRGLGGGDAWTWRPEVDGRPGPDLAQRIADRLVALDAATFGEGRAADMIRLGDRELLLTPAALALPKDVQRRMLESVAGMLRAEPWVEDVFLTEDLAGAEDPARAQAALGYFAGRSGEAVIRMRPYWFWRWGRLGTTHGSHNAYDRTVPVLLCGCGVRAGAEVRDAGPEDLAPTLARIAGLAVPETMQGRILAALLVEGLR
ncbi:MAG: alkaline phosphatase family protein [Planctomycetota bacterium]